MLIYFVLVPILIAVSLFLFPEFKAGKVLAALAQAALLMASLHLFALSRAGDVITHAGNYGGFLGITLWADTLSAVFVMLTVFIFLIVTLYNFHARSNRLYWFLMFTLEGALLGLFLTRDLFNIFVLAEVSSVVAAVFLMYNRKHRSMYDGMVFLMVNVVVMQFYLLGIGYLYMLTGALDMAYSSAAMAGIDPSQLILPFALIMVAIAAKCGLLPLFTFLPKVHSVPQAPASVAAILSGLQVKSGLYLFLRFRDMFHMIDVGALFLVISAVTAVFGAVLALTQTDIKRMLAYSTISQVGLILFGLNLNQPYAYIGSVYHIVVHTIAKVTLFLSTGIVVRRYKIRDVTKIRGVLYKMPLVSVALILAILSITGAPLFSGSISKYFLMTQAELPFYLLMLLINLGTISVFLRYGTILFGRPPEREMKVDWFKRISVLALGLLCLIGGIWGTEVIYWLFGVSLSIGMTEYAEKILILVGCWIAAYFISHLMSKHPVRLKGVSRLDVSFRGICVSIGGFFALVVLVASVLS